MEKIWLKSYPVGVPAEINPDEYPSLPAMFDESFKNFAADPAFVNFNVVITYRQLDELSAAFASFLQNSLKIKKGDRIALMMPNILQYPIALFGILRVGAIAVNVNPLYTAPELIHQMNDAGVETIIVLANFMDTVATAIKKTSLKNIIVTDLGDLFPPMKAWLVNFVLKYIQRKIPKVDIQNIIRFKNALRMGEKKKFNNVPLINTDIAFLQYTGGTTGISKGAILTHRNIIANILQSKAWFNQLQPEREIVVTALPLYHIYSLLANCLYFSNMGGLNILITNPRDIPRFVAEIAKYKFTVITGVNTLFHALLQNAKFAALDFSALKVCLGGGMAVQRAVAEQWQKVTHKPILEGYGLTEASPCVTINPLDITVYNGTVGLPAPSTDICIFDNDLQPLPVNTSGELAIKGPQIMQGYWHNPSETAKVFTKDGWLLTGDIAQVDERGYVRILERKKDMILVSGFNVYPNEIEDVLMQLPGVLEVAVIGVPDANSGESVKAFIVKNDENLTAAKVISFCREQLTGYKIPKHVQFCQSLPKTNVGKISRKTLREEQVAH